VPFISSQDHNQFEVHNDNDNLNHDYLSPSIAHAELCFEDTVDESNVDDNTPYASSSYIPAVPHEVRSASSFLADLLLRNHMSGITASPFLASLEILQKSLSLHGVVVHGLSQNEYKSLLLQHIFGGGCVQGRRRTKNVCHALIHILQNLIFLQRKKLKSVATTAPNFFPTTYRTSLTSNTTNSSSTTSLTPTAN
jgi:hypothetical protein